MRMINEAINEINELMIRDYFKNRNQRIVLTKTELYEFCVKLLKLVGGDNV